MQKHIVFPKPSMANRWKNFQTSIFSTMTELANKNNAVNLAQGFPDFEGPIEVLNLAKKHFETQSHQYAPSAGDLRLREAVSENLKKTYDIEYNPISEITITAGATEAIYCVVNALLNPGDEVVVFEPCYDSYSQAIAQAGGVLKPVTLLPPGVLGGLSSQSEEWLPDWQTLESYKRASPKLLILNSPHNPTGKMFSENELSKIVDFVSATGCFVMCDEVYEHLIFEGKLHVSLAQMEKIKNQVIRVSSAAKTFGFTGFKVGWVCAHWQITQAIRLVHQATVFCTPRFLQSAIADSLADDVWFQKYLVQFKAEYEAKRNYLVKGLRSAGFLVPSTHASYFVMCNFERVLPCKTDIEAATWFMEHKKVAAIPPSAFYAQAPNHLPWLRFAFCKSQATLEKAVQLLV